LPIGSGIFPFVVWLSLFVLAGAALVRSRLHFFSLTLLITFPLALSVGAGSLERFQEGIFRSYAWAVSMPRRLTSSVAWRLAVEEAFLAGCLVKSTDAGQHLIGNFYFVRLYPDSV